MVINNSERHRRRRGWRRIFSSLNDKKLFFSSSFFFSSDDDQKNDTAINGVNQCWFFYVFITNNMPTHILITKAFGDHEQHRKKRKERNKKKRTSIISVTLPLEKIGSDIRTNVSFNFFFSVFTVLFLYSVIFQFFISWFTGLKLFRYPSDTADVSSTLKEIQLYLLSLTTSGSELLPTTIIAVIIIIIYHCHSTSFLSYSRVMSLSE